jgi:peroxiredoxin
MASSVIQKLKEGDIAPDFDTIDVFGKSVHLTDISNRYILVSFFRYSGCPWCNLAIHRMALEYTRLQEHDCAVVAFIQSDKIDIIDNIYNRHGVRPPFPIIADYEQHYYQLYGVKNSLLAAARSVTELPSWVHAVREHGFKQTKMNGELFLVPASFVIDGRTKKIIKAAYGKSFYDTDTFVELYESIIFDEL